MAKREHLIVVRPISWPAVVIQLLLFGLVLTVGGFLGGFPCFVAGGIAFLVYITLARRLWLRYHHRGMKLVRTGNFEEACEQFEKSLQFYDRFPWADRFRAIVSFQQGHFAIRVMALANMAYCHAQLGDATRVKHYLDACLERYPESLLVKNWLKVLELGKTLAVTTGPSNSGSSSITGSVII